MICELCTWNFGYAPSKKKIQFHWKAKGHCIFTHGYNNMEDFAKGLVPLDAGMCVNANTVPRKGQWEQTKSCNARTDARTTFLLYVKRA